MIGGIERYISELFRQVELPLQALAPRLPGSEAVDAALPFPVHRYNYRPEWRRGKRPLGPMALTAARTFLRRPLGVVFSDQVQSAAVGLPLARIARAPHVVFAYGMELTPDRQYLAKRWAFRRSDAVIAISKFTRDRLSAVYGIPMDRIALARPGVNLARFAPPVGGLVCRRRSPGELVLLTVGRLAAAQPYKGFERVIRLTARLRGEFPSVRLVIVGDGDDRSRLERVAADLALQDFVRFTGTVSDEELPELYRSADLFVFPSGAPEADPYKVEGYGIVFAEAAASGLASVGYRAGGATDAVEDGISGVLTEPNEDALYEAVRSLLKDSDRRLALSGSAREHAVRALGWGTAVSAVRDLTARLLDVRRSRSSLEAVQPCR